MPTVRTADGAVGYEYPKKSARSRSCPETGLRVGDKVIVTRIDRRSRRFYVADVLPDGTLGKLEPATIALSIAREPEKD